MIHRFEDCELDEERFELRRGGRPQKVEPQVFEILRYMVRRHGQFVGKQELHDAIWRGRVVSDSTVAGAIKAARRAIGDDGTAQRLLRTVHGRGFSFVGPVVPAVAPPADGSGSRGDAETAAGGGGAIAPHRRRAVVLSADVHVAELLNGDVRCADAEAQLMSYRARLRRSIESAGGSILGTAVGGIAAEFESAARAVGCIVGLQHQGHQRAAAARGGDAPRVRVGMCELDAEDPASAIAVAARLQCLAAPGDICVTGSIAEAVRAQQGLDGHPAAGELGRWLDEFCPTIIGSTPLPAAVERPDIPQLACGPPREPREPSIVILPLLALGSDERASDLAEGLRVDVQNALVKISSLLLIAVGSANAFRGATPEFAARSFGVRYVLHGAVQLVGFRARVSLELIDTSSSQALWTEQYALRTDDPFEIQDRITRSVVAALDVKLHSGAQARIWHQALTDPEIIGQFYRGVRLFMRMECDAMAEARRLFESVAQLRTSSAIGPTWTALCHWMDSIRRWREDPTASRRLARQWAEQAIRWPDADGQAHTVLAHVQLLDGEFDAALTAGRQSVDIRPGCANAHGFFGNVLHYCGEQREAIRRSQRGIRLQPVYPPFFASVLATALMADGRPEAALVVGKEALRLNPRDVAARLALVAAARALGADRLAAVFADEVRRLDPGFSVSGYRAAQPYRDPGTIGTLAAAWLAAGLPA
jgi:adenylate cyclase